MTVTRKQYIERLFELIPNENCQQIAERLTAHGCKKMSKSTIERIKRKERDIGMEEFFAFCDVYHLSPEQIIGEFEETNISLDHAGFVTDADAEEFEGFLGEYHCWFYSTALEEQGSLIKGILKLGKTEADQVHCRASVLLCLAANDKKEFDGYAIVAKKQPVIWILLTEKNTGDLAVITLRHRYFKGECLCRVGAVMTISAGEHKQPVFQKIFITRSELSEKQVESLLPLLKTGLSTLRLPEEEWKRWFAENSRIADRIPAIRESTVLIELGSIIERQEVPVGKIMELLNVAQNEEIKRVREVEDRLAFLMNQEVCGKGERKYD